MCIDTRASVVYCITTFFVRVVAPRDMITVLLIAILVAAFARIQFDSLHAYSY